MLKALCESRSTGSGVISEVRYVGQEGATGPLQGEIDRPELLSVTLECFDEVLQ